jgi:hypothetical protein
MPNVKRTYQGLKNTMNNGMTAEIIDDSGGCNDLTVRFENGVIREHIKFCAFQSGNVALKERIISPVYDHLGRKYQSKTEMCKVYGIKRGTFDDRIRHGWSLEDALTINKTDDFLLKDKARLKETRIMKNGLKATIIGYAGANDITVQFENGAVREHVSYYRWEHGTLTDDISGKTENQKDSRINESKMMNCGVTATIIAYTSLRNITVQFETGTVKKSTYPEFARGSICEPNLNPRNQNRDFYGFKIKSFPTHIDDMVFYNTIDINTGEEALLTPQMMIDISKQREMEEEIDLEW